MWGRRDGSEIKSEREMYLKGEYFITRKNPLFIQENLTPDGLMAVTTTLHLTFLYSGDTRKQNTYYYYFT